MTEGMTTRGPHAANQTAGCMTIIKPDGTIHVVQLAGVSHRQSTYAPYVPASACSCSLDYTNSAIDMRRSLPTGHR